MKRSSAEAAKDIASKVRVAYRLPFKLSEISPTGRHIPRGFSRNLWFTNDQVDAYIRGSPTFLRTEMLHKNSLTVANVTVEQSVQRTGVFTALMTELWALLNPGELLVVENVHSLAMHNWLLKPFFQPWILLPSSDNVSVTMYAVKQSPMG